MLTNEEVLAGIRRQRESVVWINEQLPQLRKQFGDQFIAVKDREVIDADADFDHLLARVRRREDKELVTIEFVTAIEYIWVL